MFEWTIFIILIIFLIIQIGAYVYILTSQWALFSKFANVVGTDASMEAYKLVRYFPVSIALNFAVVLIFIWYFKNQ